MAAEGVSTWSELETQLHEATRQRDEFRTLYLDALETIKRLERGLLGPKTEKLPNDAQLTMEILRLVRKDSSEKQSPPSEGMLPERDFPGESSGELTTPEKKKPSPTGRKRKPQAIPRVEIEIIPPEVQLEGTQTFKRIGEEVAETTEKRRGGTFVVCYRRGKFVRKDKKKAVVARGDESEPTVFIAPPAELPIERCSAGPALLATTVVQRFLDAIPLHRMERMYAREGLPLARSTLCGWHEALSERVAPLVEAMHRNALERSPVLCTDATGVRVQAKVKCATGHFFVVIAPRLHILFFYSKKHDSGAIDTILKGYSGHLVADAHSIYDHLYTDGTIIEVGDWAHVRRYFHKSLNSDAERAQFGLGRIAALFRIERELTSLSPEDRTQARKTRSKPIVEEFFCWCRKTAPYVIEQSPIHAAIRYATNQQVALERFIYDGRLPLHNNSSEGQLRKEAIGRKNWMFLGTHGAGHINARFMSLLASCEFHELEPFAYLRDLFCLLPSWPRNRVLDLAPAYWKQTLEETDAQQRLDANIFRRLSLGLDPL